MLEECEKDKGSEEDNKKEDDGHEMKADKAAQNVATDGCTLMGYDPATPSRPLIKKQNDDPSEYERSPYIDRALDPRSAPTAKEIKLAEFLVENENADL